jgi:hypothetical protein
MIIHMLQNLVVLLGILFQRVTLIFTLTCVVALGLKNERLEGLRGWVVAHYIVFFFLCYSGTFYRGIFKFGIICVEI